jgi:hypothetical protein
MPKTPIPITSPIKGISRVMSREQQPDGTCWDALNVMPYDLFGRARVSQRFGISKLYSAQIGDGSPIQGVIAPASIIYPGQTFSVPLNGLTTLDGWPGSTFTFPGPFGPFGSTASPSAFTTLGNWVWDFKVTGNMGVASDPGSGAIGTMLAYTPLGPSSGPGNLDNLIFLVNVNGSFTGSSVYEQTADVGIFQGDPAASSSSWRNLLIGVTGSLQTIQTGAAWEFSITIFPTGNVQIADLTDSTKGGVGAVTGFTIDKMPTLNISSISSVSGAHVSFTSMKVE